MDINNTWEFWRDKVVLITGSAGSLGRIITKKLLQLPVHSVRGYDINEHQLFILQEEVKDKKFRACVGDVRDYTRLKDAFDGVNICIHTSAYKNLMLTEENPSEVLSVNINGTQNVLRCAKYAKTKQVVNISTDKVCSPESIYGLSKAVAERLILQASATNRTTDYYNVRLPNLRPSAGSVFELWDKQKAEGKLIELTHEGMKRYFLDIELAAEFVINSLLFAETGTTIIPKCKEYSMLELAKQYGEVKVIGIRAHEKMSESLWDQSEEKHIVDKGEYWVI